MKRLVGVLLVLGVLSVGVPAFAATEVGVTRAQLEAGSRAASENYVRSKAQPPTHTTRLNAIQAHRNTMKAYDNTPKGGTVRIDRLTRAYWVGGPIADYNLVRLE